MINPSVGDRVYIYSISLNEVIAGVIEGYADESSRRYKVLQDVSIEGGVLRHVVSYIYVFSHEAEALACKEEYAINNSVSLSAGNVVYLLDKFRMPVSYPTGEPCIYQVVAVYQDTNKVGLVTSYGEYIGTHSIRDVQYVSDTPLFKREDYEEGTTVVWVDNEDVFEGIIDSLNESTAKIVSVKKLMPIDYKVRLPYWKIPEGRKSSEDSDFQVLHTIIGDDLD